jgi:hypothetical protein
MHILLKKIEFNEGRENSIENDVLIKERKAS